MIAKSEAVVLRSMKYRETSRIVTFYTRAFGKISGIVKGARSAKSTVGAALQPMSHVGLVLYKKEGRELQTVTQCELLTSFRALAEDLSRMAAGMAIIELVANIAHEEEENAPLFELLVNSLSAVNEAPGDPSEHFFRFEVRLAGILGFKPVFDQCVSCGKGVPDTGAEIRFELERGGPLCSKCLAHHGNTVALTGTQLHFLASLDAGRAAPGTRPRMPDTASKNEIERFLDAFLRRHVSGIRVSRSERVFSKLLGAS